MVGRYCRMKRDKSHWADGCWKAKDEHRTARKNHLEYLTKKNSELAYTQFIRHHCSFTVRRSLSFDLLPASQLSCPEYLRCNYIARPEYLSIWGATILQDQTNWHWMHLFNFCCKRSWCMCSNNFNKQMSFCPNHLSLVKNELRPKCALKIFWVWISGEALPSCTKIVVLVICVDLTSLPIHSSCSGPYIVKCVGVVYLISFLIHFVQNVWKASSEIYHICSIWMHQDKQDQPHSHTFKVQTFDPTNY